MAEAAPTYEEQQEKLKTEYGEGLDPEDIKIPEIPEVNPEVYKDVEPMLFRGFLAQPAEINGIMFVFKSLNQHEFELLRFTEPGEGFAHVQRFYDLFLSYGVFMVDGVNILPERDQWLAELVDTFKQLPGKAKAKAVRHLSEINRRSNRAVMLTEAFAIEDQSRLRWAQVKGLDLTGASVTGIAGSDRIGMNWGQLAWRSINHFEDLRHSMDNDWENTKFVAGAFAGKGMNRVHSQDRQRRKREQEQKIDRRDQVIRVALLGTDAGALKFKDGRTPITVARTTQELADQLKQDLSGEKDWHDQVIEQYENKVREGYKAKAQEAQKLLDARSDEFKDSNIAGGNQRGQSLTRDQVDQRIADRRQRTAERLARGKENPLFDPNRRAFVEKWTDPEQVNVKTVQSSRDPAAVSVAPAARRPTAKPFNGGK